MNKYEKSLINIAERLENNYSPCSSFIYSEDYQNISDLVERATREKALYNDNLCPKCNLLLNSEYKNDGYMNYCPRCGQALDVSE